MKKRAFNLPEISTVLVIIGIIIAVTLVVVIKKQSALSARTKVRKAMSTYETVMSNITTNHNVRSEDELLSWAAADCSNTVEYFKVKMYLNKNKCTFMTYDGVYWNINYIQNPIISLDEKHMSADSALTPDLYKAFYFTASYDREGSLRVNDYSYETSLEDNALNRAAVIKLTEFDNKKI